MSSGDVTVLEDLLARRFSCRGFRSTPVAQDTLARMFEIAQRTPSGCNAQPWHVTLLSGGAADTFRTALTEHAATAEPEPDLEFPEYHGVYKQRRRESALALYREVGVELGDRAASAAQTALNYRFFDAPHVAVLTSDAALGFYGVLDCGLYLNSLLLAAEALGVAAVPQGAPAAFGRFIRRHLGLPGDRVVVCTVSLGSADMDHPANRARTDRAALADCVTWRS